jgi:hypothetical protein
MLDYLNNIWVLLICLIIFIIIVKKICNLNQPFDEDRYILQEQNQEKLKKKFNLNNIHTVIPTLTSYYVGLDK